MLGSIVDLVPPEIELDPDDVADVFRRYCDQHKNLPVPDAVQRSLAAIEETLTEMGYGRFRLTYCEIPYAEAHS